MKKISALLVLALFGANVFAGGLSRSMPNAPFRGKFPSVFKSATRSFDMTGMTAYQALAKVFEKGTMPMPEELIGYTGGLAYTYESQNEGRNAYMIGENRTSVDAPPGGLLTVKPHPLVMVLFTKHETANLYSLKAAMEQYKSTINPLKKQNGSLLVSYNDSSDQIFVRKYDKYLIFQATTNGNVILYWYGYYKVGLNPE